MYEYNETIQEQKYIVKYEVRLVNTTVQPAADVTTTYLSVLNR